MKLFAFASLCLCYGVSKAQWPSHGEMSVGEVWPLPQRKFCSGLLVQLDEKVFKFNTAFKCDILDAAIKRFSAWIFDGKGVADAEITFSTSNMTMLNHLEIIVDGKCDKYPYFGMSESYDLKISAKNGSAVLTSPSIWGALLGLETFSQLVFHPTANTYAMKECDIMDFPRFPHRGILLDTARHFLPLAKILENLDLMAQNKFNVFHWHIVDDQSFPYESKLFPELSNKGAFSGRHIYSIADVAHVIDYARMRGIRVVPEFDTPGHTLSWGKGQPGLLTKCFGAAAATNKEALIDPTIDTSYDFLLAFFTEVGQVFPDNYLHLGGDEASFWYSCWLSNKKILDFMELYGFGNDTVKLQNFYQQKLLEITDRARPSNRYIVWQEVLDNKFEAADRMIAQVWIGGQEAETMERLTVKGQQVLLSACWYLDYIGYGTTDVLRYYRCDPHNFNGASTILPLQQSAIVSKQLRMLLKDFNGTESHMVAHVWKDHTGDWPAVMDRLTERGLQTIMSSCWYLNYIQYQNHDFAPHYQCDPHGFNGTLAQKRLVLGGEACMWGEFVDGTNVTPRLWPRAGAVAERLWSDVAQTQSATKALPRFEEHRCKMTRRGYPVQPPVGPGYCPVEWVPPQRN